MNGALSANVNPAVKRFLHCTQGALAWAGITGSTFSCRQWL